MQPTLASVEDLDQWLDGVAMAEKSIQASFVESSHQRPAKPTEDKRRVLHRPNVFNNTVTHHESETNDESPRCPGCNSKHQHHIVDCRRFNEITVKERAQIVKDANLCLRCLGDDHLSKECTRVERCSKPECDGVHHPLLHGAPRLFPKAASTTPPVEFSGLVTVKSAGNCTLLPIVPVILKVNGQELPLYALLDSGSEISAINGKTAALLNLQGGERKVTTGTVEGVTKSVDRPIVNFTVTSRDRRHSFEISDVHVRENFKLERRSFDLSSLVKQWPHLSQVPIYSTKRENVAILIGQNHPAAIEIFETRKDPSNQRAPRAYLTAFGWCIAGPSGQSDNNNPRESYHSNSRKMECDTVQQQFVKADTSSTKTNIIRHTVPKEGGASGGVSAHDVQAGSTLNPQRIPPDLHHSRAGRQVYKTENLTELAPFSDHRVLHGRVKKPPLPIGGHQSTVFPRYEQVKEPLLEPIRNREGALSTAKRRAGDVAVLKPAKSVSPKLDLATPRGGKGIGEEGRSL